MQYYRHRFSLPQRPDCFIFVQTEDEIEIARRLSAAIKEKWHAPKFFYHLMKGGHISALHRHKHDKYFARFDIQNFFSSITRNKIQRALKKVGFPLPDAQSIAHRSCVVVGTKRILPFGYVQSPLLASLVLDVSAMGTEMLQIRKSGVFLSVFMDDIILSHDDNEVLSNACSRLEAAAERSNFILSVDKREGPAEEITAFNIDIRNEGLSINVTKFEDFSMRILQKGYSNSSLGILGYVRAINNSQADQLAALIHG